MLPVFVAICGSTSTTSSIGPIVPPRPTGSSTRSSQAVGIASIPGSYRQLDMQSPLLTEAPYPPLVPARSLPVDPAPLVLLLLALGAGIALDIGLRGGVHNASVA